MALPLVPRQIQNASAATGAAAAGVAAAAAAAAAGVAAAAAAAAAGVAAAAAAAGVVAAAFCTAACCISVWLQLQAWPAGLRHCTQGLSRRCCPGS